MGWSRIAVGIALAGLLAVAGGVVAQRRAAHPAAADVTPGDPPRPPGFWVEDRSGAAGERDLIARLEAIGYLPGVVDADPSRVSGVTRREPDAWSGARLYTSGHAPEAVLIDADGRPLHRWRFDPARLWPDLDPARHPGLANYRRAYLLPRGGLLAIVEGVGVLKLDRDSRLVWAQRNGAHHAAERLPDGRILLLARTAHVVPAIDPARPILEDFVVELSADGRELRRVSLVEALLRSEYADLARSPHPDLPPGNRRNAEAGDVHHTNSLQWLAADHPGEPRLRAGQVLVSSLHLSAVMALDLDERRVTWLLRGDFLAQHEARLLANGHLLLFDNHTPERGSRALELTLSGETVWQYPPPGGRERIYSSCCGSALRLPNGHTLIAITEAGRALEVTPDHRVVWEFLTPHRAGEGGRLLAALFEMQPATIPGEWLARPAEPARPR